jgi:hypothetical protein
MFKFNLVSSLFIAVFIVPSAQANVSWSFHSGNCLDCTTNINTESFGNSHDYGSSSNSNSVTVSAFSTTGDSGASSGSAPDYFQTAHLTQWGGGFGVRSQEDGPVGSQPHHAIDNNDKQNNESDRGDVDVIQFSFNENMSLNGLNIGWGGSGYGTDSDVSVLFYDEANGSGDKSLAGKTFAQLLSNGWSLIGHYSNLQVGSTEAINAANIFSSDWLITAYTPEAGGEQGWSFGNDFFKLSGLSGDLTVDNPDQGSVPEPSSIALFLLGLIGWKMSNNGSRRTISNMDKLIAA